MQNNKEYFKKYRLEHKDEIREKHREYTRKNKDKVSKWNKKSYRKNIDKVKVRHAKYYAENKEWINRLNNDNYSKKMNNDESFRIAHSLRTRMSTAIRSDVKIDRIIWFLGCSLKDLKIHLEKQFIGGMNWSNYGRTGWHIDHIKPCSKYDLTKLKNQKECFHYTNLQPLWAKDNLMKHNH